jgi:hypothetical protein
MPTIVRDHAYDAKKRRAGDEDDEYRVPDLPFL